VRNKEKEMALRMNVRGNKLEQQDTPPDKEQETTATTIPEWVMGSSSYLASVQASLAALTEADKEKIHFSLQE
jgi:hypothetical protein